MSGSASIIPYMGIIAVLLIIMKLGSANVTIGYDCDTQLQNKFIYLEDINYCDPNVDDVKISSENIAVLQINEYKEATILQCKIELHRVVEECGSQLTNLPGNDTIKEYIYPISRKECEIALDHGRITIGKTTIDNLKMDGTTTHSVVLAGSVDSNGVCSGEKYSDPYGTWKNVVVTGTVKITLQTHLAKVDIDSDSIELPSGYECKFSKGECIDSHGGYTFRDILPLRFCSDRTYSVLYNGTATKLKFEDGRVYAIMIKDTRYSFNTIGNESSCGVTLYKTDSPKLYIAEGEDLKQLEKFKIVGNHTDNSNVSQYENDKLIYAEKFMHYPIKYLFRNVIEHKCNRLNAILRIALPIASMEPDKFAFEIMGGPGYMAVMGKDQFHIVQCVPVEVELQQQDECYNRLPILRGNERLFLTPWTHIITNNATELCNSTLLEDPELNSTTPKVMTEVTETLGFTTPKPKTLKHKRPEPQYQNHEIKRPNSKLTWEHQIPDDPILKGIYTEEEVQKYWELKTHPERLNPPPREVATYPDANGNVPGVIYLNRGHKNSSSYGECFRKKFSESWNIFAYLFSCM